MYYINENVKNLYRIFDDQNNRSGYLRLDWNENPIGLPDYFVNDISISAKEIAMYPETDEFINTLSSYLNVSKDNICITNGSIEGIRYIIEAFTSENGRVVGISPGYPMYKVFCNMYGRQWIDICYKDYKVDINDLINKLTPDTQLLCLMNPNNPIGDCFTDNEFELIIKICKALNITVMIDEAYYLFSDANAIKYALNEPNVFITRSFSKMFSMAGCRLGYVVGSPENILMIKKMCNPDNVNFFALKVANKLLNDESTIKYLKDEFYQGKKYLLEELSKNNYKYIETNGNFILIKPKNNANHIVSRMKNEEGILIKCYKNIDSTGDYLRVTIADINSMKKFIEALIRVDEIRVITYGTFDLFHYGHKRILERAKKLGDKLIVGVTRKEYDDARGKTNVIESLEERINHIKESGFADMIITEDDFGQKEKDFEKYSYDILTLGSDWTGKYDYLEDMFDCKVVYLPRTEGISSTLLRSKLVH